MCIAVVVILASTAPAWGSDASRLSETSKTFVATGSITAFGPTPLALLPGTPDGAIPYELTWHFEGDLTGDVTTKGEITFDAAAGTTTEHATETFVGTIKGVGKGTLTWDSTWTAPNGTTTRGYVTKVTGGTARLKKLRGHGEESLEVLEGEFVFPGRYTFTLKKRSG